MTAVTLSLLATPDLALDGEPELPSAYAARLATAYALLVSEAHKKEFGQFFTPASLGAYLASLTTFIGAEVRLLDPGFGTGVLACALVERLVQTNAALATVFLDAYDVDAGVLPYAQATLTYLKDWLASRGIALQAQLLNQDFVLAQATEWQLAFQPITPRYDVVIANPPYFKLGKDDPRNALVRPRQFDQPNIYALFVVQATLLTQPGGELLFLIPRSFCSGPYFERFRSFLYDHLRLDYFHLFHARDQAFKKDAVLQENILFKATRLDQATQQNYPIQIASSTGTQDLNNPEYLSCRLDEVVDLGSREKVLFLPTTEAERALITSFKTWRHRLQDFGLEVSTGPVVAFRTTEYLREAADAGHVPLLWIDHVRRASIHWPNARGRQQYLALAGGKKASLLPVRNYVLLRRFSAKGDKHRLIAAPFLAADWAQYAAVGLENKLNYCYARTGELTTVQTVGLSALLNSNLYDAFFRIFNGNTQVSATEARALPMPPLATIEAIGEQLLAQGEGLAEDVVNQVLAL
jgi:adenine-specific DNA-methyltransferase